MVFDPADCFCQVRDVFCELRDSLRKIEDGTLNVIHLPQHAEKQSIRPLHLARARKSGASVLQFRSRLNSSPTAFEGNAGMFARELLTASQSLLLRRFGPIGTRLIGAEAILHWIY